MRTIAYDRRRAVAYAHKWAYGRNPRYYDYQRIGGDCTNFASQCVYAGASAMNYAPTLGWYYRNANDKSPAWTGVPFIYKFLVGNQGIGPFGHEVGIAEVQPGDICQLSFNGSQFHHTPFVVAIGAVPSPTNVLLAAHTADADNRPLNSYSYSKVRFVHIDGVRIQ